MNKDTLFFFIKNLKETKDMKNFKNIIGYDHIKKELERLIDCINNK